MANKILIVDDEPDALQILAIRLRHEGYEVICAANGQEALELTQKNSPEIIFLDIMMPDMDGLEVKAELNKDPFLASIPVIFLSADFSTESKIKGFSLGASDYITKPFNPKEFLARIDAALTKKHHYEKLSITDGLTGVYNHAFFKQQLSHYFNLAKRYSTPFTLIMIDINGLKKINDKYGHTAGDCVLKEFSSATLQCIRVSDAAFRYGGDEFAILLPETNISQAKTVIKKLKENIRKNVVSIPDSGKKITFSISIGAAEFDVVYKDETEFFDYADKELYKDKTNSKSR